VDPEITDNPPAGLKDADSMTARFLMTRSSSIGSA